jgi:rRNA pseudouridine-1189 N-methylase Emg1 (Nep1/Mra1 family)
VGVVRKRDASKYEVHRGVETVKVILNNGGHTAAEDRNRDNSPEGRPVRVHRERVRRGSTGPLKT